MEGARSYAAQVEAVKQEREFLEQELEKVRTERATFQGLLAQVRSS